MFLCTMSLMDGSFANLTNTMLLLFCSFLALGNSAVASSSPPAVGERKLFSSVAKLGFAAGHDSPALKIDGTHSLSRHEVTSDSSGLSGTLSFSILHMYRCPLARIRW